jgi:hypothetical protein
MTTCTASASSSTPAPVSTTAAAFTLSLGLTDLCQVWYDDDRDLANDGGPEHAILERTVTSYFNAGGSFYAIPLDDNKYNGDFSVWDEGDHDPVVNGFHAGGTGYPVQVPAPPSGALLLDGLGAGLPGRTRRRRAL